MADAIDTTSLNNADPAQDAGGSGGAAPTSSPVADPAGGTILGSAGVDGGDAVAAGDSSGSEGMGEHPGSTDPVGSAPEQGVPEQYQIEMPDGVAFDAEAFGAVEPALREAGLTNAQAQALATAYSEQILPVLAARAEQQMVDQAVAQRTRWANETNADPEIGGPNIRATQDAAARAFDHYGIKAGSGFRQFLDDTGLGNHPEMIRFVARIGRDLGEAGFERGGTQSAAKSPEQKLYGDEYQPK